MWGIKATTIPVVIGVMVLIKKGLGKYIQQIVGNIKMHELQKITLLGTSHILTKALSIKIIDFYLILTLGSRNGLGYSVVLWYSIKKDNNNNNNNNNDNNNNINISTTTTTTTTTTNNSSISSSSINKIMY